MSDKLVKTNIPGYYKNVETGVVINTDTAEYDRYVSQVNQHREYIKTKEDIRSLKLQMEEMKRLILEKAKNV